MLLLLYISHVTIIFAIFTIFATTALAFAPGIYTASTKAKGMRRLKSTWPFFPFSSFPPCAGRLLSSSNDGEYESTDAKNADPDLFDYFDPLLSPHSYPEGISPETKPIVQTKNGISEQNPSATNEQQQQSSPRKVDFGFRLPIDPVAINDTEDKQEVGQFNYFDPLRSPHAYPDGILSDSKLEGMLSSTHPLEVIDDNERDSSTSSNGSIRRKKIGVLLMDHGSRNEASNARLQAMAKLYQMTLVNDDDGDDHDKKTASTIIVRAAHMEIATPSIPDGLRTLKDEGVDEIICHPFFLSADGRHVKEDIPRIINKAIDDLWGADTTAIPIVTTAPVGSNTQLMLGAIHSLVRENSRYLKPASQ